MSDILEVQYEIARDVVVPLNRRIRRKMSSARVAEAHALYLQGLFYWYQWTAGSLLTSVRLYEQAVLKDPDYALAYAGLADSYGALGYLGVLPVKHAQEKKDHVLKTAFRLDPDLPEALTSLAMTKSHYEWDWADAERHLRRALTLQPQSVTAHRHYAIILHCQGRFDEAREQIERAYRLDPLSAQFRATAAYIEQRARHNHRALEWYRRALEIVPNYQRAHLGMAEVYLQDGDFTRAMESLEFACRLARNDAETLGVLGYALGRRGQRHEPIAVARQLTTLAVDRSGTAVALADVHIGVGDNGRALELLEEARNAHDPRMVQLKVNPRYDVLRSQPRFVRLLKSLGFTL